MTIKVENVFQKLQRSVTGPVDDESITCEALAVFGDKSFPVV